MLHPPLNGGDRSLESVRILLPQTFADWYLVRRVSCAADTKDGFQHVDYTRDGHRPTGLVCVGVLDR